MTALAAGYSRPCMDEHNAVYQDYLVEAGETIYQGALVMVDTDGYLTTATDTANCKVVGVADETVTNSGADGAASCRVKSGCRFLFTASSIAVNDFDAPLLYVVDDNTVDETSPANSVKAGIHVPPHVSSTEGWMYIPPFGVFTYGL